MTGEYYGSTHFLSESFRWMHLSISTSNLAWCFKTAWCYFYLVICFQSCSILRNSWVLVTPATLYLNNRSSMILCMASYYILLSLRYSILNAYHSSLSISTVMWWSSSVPQAGLACIPNLVYAVCTFFIYTTYFWAKSLSSSLGSFSRISLINLISAKNSGVWTSAYKSLAKI